MSVNPVPQFSSSPVRQFSSSSVLQFVLVLAALCLVFWQVFVRLVDAWIVDGNYSHGFLIIPIALYFVWERREKLAAAPMQSSWFGLVVLAGGIAMLLAGLWGSELFLSRIALLPVLAGIVLFLFGWAHLRILAFPIAFLFLMIPIPAIIFNQIAFPLQLLASQAGRVGHLDRRHSGAARRQRADPRAHVARSRRGVQRHPLARLAHHARPRLRLLHGSAPWVRTLIVLSAIPVAIVANGARVAGTGMAAQWIGPEAAQGFFHEFSGWIVFIFAFIMILVIQRIILKFAPTPKAPDQFAPRPSFRPVPQSFQFPMFPSFASSSSSSSCWRASSQSRAPIARKTRRCGCRSRCSRWNSADGRASQRPPFTEQVLKVLGLDDYLTRLYRSSDGTYADLYVGYWKSQRQGDTMHSPQNCLPGAGWEPVSQTLLTFPDPRNPTGAPLSVNRFMIQKGLERQLVLYWYQGRGRVVGSEYWSKIYLVLDAARYNRTDAALVRIVVPVGGTSKEAEDAAQKSALDFVNQLMPALSKFLPD